VQRVHPEVDHALRGLSGERRGDHAAQEREREREREREAWEEMTLHVLVAGNRACPHP
jgi:hypothetical protein